jgi:hypothetical protein
MGVGCKRWSGKPAGSRTGQLAQEGLPESPSEGGRGRAQERRGPHRGCQPLLAARKALAQASPSVLGSRERGTTYNQGAERGVAFAAQQAASGDLGAALKERSGPLAEMLPNCYEQPRKGEAGREGL